MSNVKSLSEIQVILLAAHFISDVNVESLQVLAAERREVLTHDIIYHLLLALYPTDEAARSALLALLQSIRSDFDNVSQLDASVDTSSVARLSSAAVAREAAQIELPPYQRGAFTGSEDHLSIFLVSWAHHVEANAGSLQDVLSILQPFAASNKDLRHWVQTYLQPLERLQYDFYPEDQSTLDLYQLEALSGSTGVAALLQHTLPRSEDAEIARDLDEVVVPWISGCPHKASWKDVCEWIFLMSQKDFRLSAKALLEWNGPRESTDEVLRDLAQTALAVAYLSDDSTDRHLSLVKAVWQRAASLAAITCPDIDTPYPNIGQHLVLKNISDANFLQHMLLLKDNELTRVTDQSTCFMGGVIKTAEILSQYKLNVALPLVAKISMSGSQEQQRQELRRLLQQVPQMTTSEPDWQELRDRVIWLQGWQRSPTGESEAVAYLGRLPLEYLETEILDAMLGFGQFQKARSMYISSSPPLRPEVVKDHVISAIYSAYDNASNGNRNRGGVKRASDMHATFRSAYPESTSFRAVDHLLRATHSLSFYHLTLQHGIPFQPVNIRAQKDPLILIEKVLEQNQRSYAKLDDLVEIGRNLVLSGAGTQDPSLDEDDTVRVLEAEHRVTFAAISSALGSHDFDTAYSYITSRLLTSRTPSQANFIDDTSWRAAYAAGRYRPSSSSTALHTQISSLSKRMELLSLALTLAPTAEPLSEILGTWRRCEEEMNSLRSNALEEERAFDGGGDDEIPGGFGLDDRERDVADTRSALAKRSLARSATYEEEAPVGLFDMARGAAAALRKNAFPLQGPAGGDFKIQNQTKHASGEFDAQQEGERVRKRDMVSNMVTSGLVSGMGWVLGAQPADRHGQPQ